MVLGRSQYVAPRERWAQLWPFLATFALALLLAAAVPGGPDDPVLVGLGALVVVVGAIVVLFAPWSDLPELSTLVPVVAVCVAVDLLRAGSSGGSSAGYGSVLLIPVIWQAMHRRRLMLWVTMAVVAVANIVAVVVIGSTLSRSAQWRGVILFTVVAVTIGETIHRLVRDRARLLDQVSTAAGRDPLTELPNRRVWEEHVPRELAIAVRRRTPLAIAILDLDHFKRYNDRNGHVAGDRLLVEASNAWRDALRSSDLLVRWGGEEFALLMPVTDEHGARTLLERLQAVTPGDQTFSAGITVFRRDRGTTEVPTVADLVEAADRALYVAKESGRARAELAAAIPATPSPLLARA